MYGLDCNDPDAPQPQPLPNMLAFVFHKKKELGYWLG